MEDCWYRKTIWREENLYKNWSIMVDDEVLEKLVKLGYKQPIKKKENWGRNSRMDKIT